MFISENSEKHWIVEHPCENLHISAFSIVGNIVGDTVEKGMSEREA